MNIQELNQQLSQLNTDYQLFQNDMANNKQFSSNTQTNNREIQIIILIYKI